MILTTVIVRYCANSDQQCYSAANDAMGHSHRHLPFNLFLTGRVRSLCLSVGGPEPVADTGLCQDVFRPLRIGLDFLPQLANIDPQILSIRRLIP